MQDELLAWKSASKGATALLVEGTRRVGKSTVVEEFAKAEYESYLIVDFTKASNDFKQTFLDTRSDMDSFFLYLSAELGLTSKSASRSSSSTKYRPPAREFVKHLVADARYDYVGASEASTHNKDFRLEGLSYLNIHHATPYRVA